MSISVQCPNCKKKLKARDDLAGKRVKCPACGQPVVVSNGRPAQPVKPASTPAQSFIDAAAAGDVQAVAKLIGRVDFWLVEDLEDSSDDGMAALLLEVDDFPALVAFTSTDNARTFADSNPDLLDGDGTMPAFEVSGADMLTHLPDECGLILNPESDECAVLPPEMVEEIKGRGRR